LDVRPGELYSRVMLMQTMTRLSQMVHFNQESTIPSMNPVGEDLLDLAYNLEEVASDEVSVSGGWGAGMFVGSIGVTLKNFSARNFFKRGAWRPYPGGDNQQLAINGQSNGTYYKALSLSFTEPWLGGKKPNGLTVSTYYSDQTDPYSYTIMGIGSNKHFRTLGASAGINRRLKWPDNWFSLYNELSYQAYNLKDWENYGFIISNGTSNIVALRTILGRSTLNDHYFPSAGSDLSLSLTLTPPYSLFDGVNYSDPNLSDNDRYRWVEYHKWLFKADWYFPLSTNNKLVLRTNVQTGFLGSYNNHKTSPFEGFQLGGDGMTGYSIYGVDIVSLRGYENGSMTPSSSQSKAYVKYSAEMRYKILQQGQTMIYGLVFAEAGNAFTRVKDFDPFLLKRSAGAGVRIMLPMIGMLGIDWGYGFDRDITGKKGGGHPHFMIGQQF
jgi:outer membrane protein insertion porin family